VQQESADFIDLLRKVYADFGFEDILIKLSTRPPKRIGDDATWDRAEKALAAALDSKGLKWSENPGEGAFYGPKVEFSLKDSLGRVWQCGTLQLDFALPGRLGAEYVAEDNARKVPVMLHRAILGSLERFIGILIEHYAGAFPVWLAPVQVVVAGITDRQAAYVTGVVDVLQKAGFRARADLRNEKITYKIREHSLQKLPYQVIVGDQEMAAQSVAVRTRKGEDLGQMSLEAFVHRLREDEARLGRTA
jgi:threonyl-tRNA synthetase